MVLSLELFDYCQAQPQLQLNWAELALFSLSTLNLLILSRNFADPQPEFRESLFLSSQSKDFHQIWAGDPRSKVLHNFELFPSPNQTRVSQGSTPGKFEVSCLCHLQPNPQTPLLDLYSLLSLTCSVRYLFINFTWWMAKENRPPCCRWRKIYRNQCLIEDICGWK